MPSRTAEGKRLSGAQQQKLKLHRAATVVDANRQQIETAIELVDVAIVDAVPLGVDTPEDLDAARIEVA